MPFFRIGLFDNAEVECVRAGAEQPGFFRVTASLNAQMATGLGYALVEAPAPQAAGDFILAQDGPDLIAQTRQIPGPPAHPNTATNTAIAAKTGANGFAFCVTPPRAMITRKETDLAAGDSLSLAGGVQVRQLPSGARVMQDGTGDDGLANLNTINGVRIDVQIEAAHPSVAGLLSV